MVTIKDGCGATSCCDWKQKLEEAYKRATASINKIGDDAGNVYYPDGTGYVKVPLPTKAQVDNIAQIDGIKASVDDLNKAVPALEAQVTGVTESLVSNVEVLNGTTAGKFKVRIDREKAALIDSNDYDLSKVNSVELIQGSGPAMVKAQLTLSDGTVLRSDDFLFTTESIGTDVYISSFTFKAGNVDGTISADIGLNNGTTLEANNFVVPTDPSVVSSITDLQTRMTAVENGSGVTGLDALKTTVDTHTSEIAQLTNDVGGLTTSKVNVAQGTENAGKALVVGQDGNVTVGSAGGAGEVWEKIDFNNWPTDWAVGDKIKFIPNCYVDRSGSAPNWTSPITVSGTPVLAQSHRIIEIEVGSTGGGSFISASTISTSKITINTMTFNPTDSQLNSGSIFGSLRLDAFNGNSCANLITTNINLANVSDFISKMWRCRTSS